MKIVLMVLAALVLLAAVVLGIGATLPVGHRAVGEAVYPASRDSLFAVITDLERFPEWRSGVERVERQPAPAGEVRYVEFGADGEIPYQVIENVPGRRRVTRIAGNDLPFGGTWTFELTDAPGGTRLRITEDGEVYHPVFRFVSRYIMGHERSVNGFLDDLRRRLGGGDGNSVRPAP